MALLLRSDANTFSLLPAFLALLSCVFAASANYVLNEWLDASFDAFHPSKSARPCVTKCMDERVILVEYFAFAGAALLLAHAIASLVFYAALALLLSGIVYNTRPFRTKDVVFLDVLSEALNNPVRLVFGWAMVDPTTMPPGSILLAYWMGGAFLMNTKRLAEFREITDKAGAPSLHQYRRSFTYYSDRLLIITSFFYGLASIGALMIFVVKYRIEYLLAAPALVALFALYLDLGLRATATAQAPEQLFREPALVACVAIVVMVLAILTFVDIPFLEQFASAHYITIPK